MLENLKKHTKKLILKKITGLDPSHIALQKSLWTIILWDAQQVPELQKNDHNLQSRIDNLLTEMSDTEKNTTVTPDSIQLITTQPKSIYQYQQRLNILTTAGMGEMAKRSTAQTTSTNTHHAIGSGTTAEALTDTALETELARKTIGTRAVTNQTERYSTSFADTDVASLPQDFTEAGIFTAASGGVLILRVTAVATTLSTGKIATISTSVSHENGTAV